MEDILASIRRIIAEDQSNSLGRSGLGGLTRRSHAAAPVEEAAPPQQPVPTALHDAPAVQSPHHSEAHPEPQVEPSQENVVAEAEAPQSYEAIAPYEPASEPQPHSVFAPEPELAYEPAHAAMSHEPEDMPYETPTDEVEHLMSPVAGASITSSFQTLAESVMLQDPDMIERVMRESMRPLLKAWLDDHLPSIVERLVRTEIERVARGGRSRNA